MDLSDEEEPKAFYLLCSGVARGSFKDVDDYLLYHEGSICNYDFCHFDFTSKLELDAWGT